MSKTLKLTIYITAILLLTVAGVFLVSRFVGQTLPGVTVTQTGFDLSDVVPSGLIGYWTFNGLDIDLASTTAEVLDVSGNGNHGDLITSGAGSSWWDTGYGYRQKITITAGGGSGGAATTTTAGYVVLATTTQAVLKTSTNGGKVESDTGVDIVFVDDDHSTVLDYHLESYASTTGEVVAWAEVLDISSTTAKDFYMYYGNSSATNQSDEAGTYQSFVKGVWNNHEDPSATAPQIFDSTSNNGDGTSAGTMTAGDSIAGYIGNALEFDGTDDHIDFGDTADITTEDLTVTAWLKLTAVGGGQKEQLIGKINDANSTSGGKGWAVVSTDSALRLFIADTAGENPSNNDDGSTTQVDDNVWHYVAVRLDRGTDTQFYLDGVADGSGTASASETGDLSSAHPLFMAGGYNKGATPDIHFGGIIDEVRIYNIALHAMDILTDYNNQVNVGTFLTYGAEENAVFPEGYVLPGRIGQGLRFDGTDDYINVGNVGTAKTIAFWMKADDITSRKIINIDGTDQIEINGSSQVAATDFPAATVYVDGSSSSATVTTGWHHVIITDTTGVSASTFEIGRVSTSYFDGQIDDVRVYDRVLTAAEIAELSSATKRVTIQPSPTNTILNGLVGYWTFDGPDMDWASTTAEALDRSGKGNRGNVTNGSSEVAVPGKIGQALDFGITGDNEYVSVPNFNDITGYPLTIAAWSRANDSTHGSSDRAVSVNKGVNEYYSIGWRESGGNSQPTLAARNTTFEDVVGPDTPVGTWTHIVGVFNSATSRDLYINGAFYTSDTVSVTELTDANEVGIGASGAGANHCSCDVDEVRIYNRALSAAEIAELAGATKRASIDPGAGQAMLVPSGLVGYWSFDGRDMDWASTTAEALDRSGQENNGDVTNFGIGGVRPGKVGQALNFDGSDDYVAVPGSSSLNDLGPLSISLWVYLNDTNTGRNLVFKGGAGEWQLRIASNSNKSISFFEDWATSDPTATWNNVVAANEWAHFVLTWNGNDNSGGTDMQLYKNGVAQTITSTVAGGTDNKANDGALEIAGPTSDLNGIMDEVRVYNRALSAAEVLELYQGR